MKVLELSGAHIGKKIRVSWKLPRKNAKLHSYTGYVNYIHNNYIHCEIKLYKIPNTADWVCRVAHDIYIPYYADVEFLDD